MSFQPKWNGATLRKIKFQEYFMRFAEKERSAGFTLVEVLLVASLSVVVFLSITNSFILGTKIFSKLIDLSQYEDMSFFMERLTADLRNCAVSSPLEVPVSKSKLLFQTLMPDDKVTEPLSYLWTGRPLQVVYWLDEGTHQISRNQSDPLFHLIPEKTDVIVKNVKSLKFEVLDSGEGKPDRLRAQLEVVVNQSVHTFKKEIRIPSRYVNAFKS